MQAQLHFIAKRFIDRTFKAKRSEFQIYYCEYYEKYLEEYERRRAMMMTATASNTLEPGPPPTTSSNLEASILMDDIMNNGMTFCSIM